MFNLPHGTTEKKMKTSLKNYMSAGEKTPRQQAKCGAST